MVRNSTRDSPLTQIILQPIIGRQPPVIGAVADPRDLASGDCGFLRQIYVWTALDVWHQIFIVNYVVTIVTHCLGLIEIQPGELDPVSSGYFNLPPR